MDLRLQLDSGRQWRGRRCIESLRLPKLSMPSAVAALADVSKFWTSPGQISVVGPRIQRFEASAGTAGMSAEPCTPVTIDWIIDQLPCGALSGSLVQARLLRDGVQIAPSGAATTLPLIGSFLDRRELTVTYRLEVSSTDALGNSCGTVTRDLQVVRGPKLIHFGLPAEVSPGNPQTIPILISCPAPAGGLTVTSLFQSGDAVKPPRHGPVRCGKFGLHIHGAGRREMRTCRPDGVRPQSSAGVGGHMRFASSEDYDLHAAGESAGLRVQQFDAYGRLHQRGGNRHGNRERRHSDAAQRRVRVPPKAHVCTVTPLL
jgi:hypothetical protein